MQYLKLITIKMLIEVDFGSVETYLYSKSLPLIYSVGLKVWKLIYLFTFYALIN